MTLHVCGISDVGKHPFRISPGQFDLLPPSDTNTQVLQVGREADALEEILVLIAGNADGPWRLCFVSSRLSWSSQSFSSKYHRLYDLNNTFSFLIVLEPVKFKIMVLLEALADKGLLPALLSP